MGPRARYSDRSASRRADLAGPVPRWTRFGERAGRRGAQGQSARVRPAIPQLVTTAWASAATFAARTSAAGPMARAFASHRRRLEANSGRVAKVLTKLAAIQKEFNGAQSGKKRISLADLIVLAGLRRGRGSGEEGWPLDPGALLARTHGRVAGADRCRVVRSAGANCGRVPQLPPRRRQDARRGAAARSRHVADPDRSGNDGAGRGLRALHATFGQATHGVLTSTPGTLTNDSSSTCSTWASRAPCHDRRVYEGRDRASGGIKWTGPAWTWCSFQLRVRRWPRSMLATTTSRSSSRTSSRLEQGDEPGSVRFGVGGRR